MHHRNLRLRSDEREVRFFFVEIVAELGSRFGLTIEQSNARFSAPVLAFGFPFFRDSTYIAMLIAPAMLVNRDFTFRPLFSALFLFPTLARNVLTAIGRLPFLAIAGLVLRLFLFLLFAAALTALALAGRCFVGGFIRGVFGFGAIVGLFCIVSHGASPLYIRSNFVPSSA